MGSHCTVLPSSCIYMKLSRIKNEQLYWVLSLLSFLSHLFCHCVVLG